MSEVKIVGRGVDTPVLNVSYADKQFQPIKQKLDADLQEKLNSLQGEARINESSVVTNWAFKGFNLFMKEKGSRGQWRWIQTCPLVTLQSRVVGSILSSHKCASRLNICGHAKRLVMQLSRSRYSENVDALQAVEEKDGDRWQAGVCSPVPPLYGDDSVSNGA